MLYTEREVLEELYVDICKKIVDQLQKSRSSNIADLLDIAKQLKQVLNFSEEKK